MLQWCASDVPGRRRGSWMEFHRGVYLESRSDIQSWTPAVHPSCSASVDLLFYPLWDGKMSINFRVD